MKDMDILIFMIAVVIVIIYAIAFHTGYGVGSAAVLKEAAIHCAGGYVADPVTGVSTWNWK